MDNDKKEDYLTTAPEKQKVTINTGGTFPNLKNVPGDSVDKYMDLKEANAIIAQDEIRQQNENL